MIELEETILLIHLHYKNSYYISIKNVQESKSENYEKCITLLILEIPND